MKKQQLHQSKIFISLSLIAIAGSGCTKLHNNSQFSGSNEFTPMSNSEEWQVIRVSDGDTIVVRQMDGREKKLRLCGVDSPEIKHGKQPGQALGIEAKANLQRLVDEADKTVMVTEIESDRYGRTVAEVFSSKNGVEKSLNEEQLSSGLAMVYRSYVKKCPNAITLGKAEEIAKNKKLGVWGDSSTVPPWEFRKRQRQNNGN
ncbi:thermonuclease family protein [Nostoc sp. 'Lobaria pulmonaria (5183) cyanobiont']|uniref:thermonuclease family protein n=1 Tax=Nostoc sp. 'Lobaria pulmonaria (5183) cyanobiont' TaxID=1618022 RepID=UPI000CF34331|nr:thermonuclease family protein [Nostoc sp. 'Lobaria pulmonaria (5183) cyanobiont']AVH74397.1 nuclease [Nostoc sp. 'Lobaria pulmonaria (5183) cyanobiont']